MNSNFNRYKLKITLDYDQRIYRMIGICGSDTLDDLSDVILASFNFSDDHLYLFNMDNVKVSKNSYNKMPEYGGKSTDISIEKLHLVEKQKLVYLYDFGDEWVFRISVLKIESENNYSKPQVLETAGEVEQYPDFNEEYDENVLLNVIDKLQVIDILNEIEDEFIQEEYLSLFDYNRSLNGRDPEKLRNEIMKEVLEHPDHLMFFLPSKQFEHLNALVHNENIFLKDDWCELMKLYSYGFCRMKEDENSFVIEIPKQVIDVYKPYMLDTKNRKTIKKNAELQKITEYLLSKYGVIEMDNLLQILCFITNRKIEYTEFKYLVYSRLHYLGDFIVFTGDENILYVSLFNQEDALEILKQRNASEEYKKLSYPVFTLQHCRKAIKQNYYLEYPSFRAWWDYLKFDIRLEYDTCNRLLSITTYAALIQDEDEKMLLKECRKLFHQDGCNFTRMPQKLIKALSKGIPAAVEKGRSYEEYGKTGLIRDGMYNSLEEAIQARFKKSADKKEKEALKNSNEKKTLNNCRCFNKKHDKYDINFDF
ncbi:IS1096 element passenger TnpR family protein [Acetobacterium carbinolicum]|uniref:IS1096 element passenger TnpR family protein n=1 Tax=Acetobacterium carbinolicum TaxID=52690 RepID=UPI0039C93D2D